MKTYRIDVTTWSDFLTHSFGAANKEAALEAAFRVNQKKTPGYDIVRLWGEGQILWTSESGWRNVNSLAEG